MQKDDGTNNFEEVKVALVNYFASINDVESIGEILDAFCVIIRQNTLEDVITLLSLNQSIGMEFTPSNLDKTFKSLHETYIQLGREKLEDIIKDNNPLSD